MTEKELKKKIDYKTGHIENAVYAERMERIFKLMVENNIDEFQDGNLKIVRKSLEIIKQKDHNDRQIKMQAGKVLKGSNTL